VYNINGLAWTYIDFITLKYWIILFVECKSSTTAVSMPVMHRITQSAVNENTVFFSGLTDTTRAKAINALSGDLIISS